MDNLQQQTKLKTLVVFRSYGWDMHAIVSALKKWHNAKNYAFDWQGYGEVTFADDDSNNRWKNDGDAATRTPQQKADKWQSAPHVSFSSSAFPIQLKDPDQKNEFPDVTEFVKQNKEVPFSSSL